MVDKIKLLESEKRQDLTRIQALEREKREVIAKKEALKRDVGELAALIALAGAKVNDILEAGADDHVEPRAVNAPAESKGREQPEESAASQLYQLRRRFPQFFKSD